jgi:glucose uptake protein
MVIPATYSAALLLAVLTLLCWGTWVNTSKLAGKWRFELFYYDFAIGLFLISTVAAFTLGAMGADITFIDNLTIVRRLQIGYAFLAGAVFNLGNMLLLGGVTVAGVTLTFPIAMGLALFVGMGWRYYWWPAGNLALLLLGCLLIVAAMVVVSIGYSRLQRIRAMDVAHAAAITGKKAPAGKRTSAMGIAISIVSGLLMGAYFPLVETARQGDLEMGPYPIAFLFAAGVLATTLLYNLYFLNLPVRGEVISMFQYFQGGARQHLLGLAGGAIWGIGAIANLSAAAAPADAHSDPAVNYAIGQGGAVVAMLCGLLYWKEFSGSPPLRMMMWAAAAIFATGVALVVAAPLSGTR